MRAVTLLAVAAAGCCCWGQPDGREVLYTCRDGATFSVRYVQASDRKQPGAAFVVREGDEASELRQWPPGKRYANANIRLTTRGDAAVLDLGDEGVLEDCRGSTEQGRARFTGELSQADGSTAFVLCNGSLRVAAAPSAGARELEQSLRAQSGRPLTATVEGRMELVPGPQGHAEAEGQWIPALHIDRVISVSSDTSGCAAAAGLQNTAWRLTRLGPDPAPQDLRVPATLQFAKTTANGFTGCNSFSGPWSSTRGPATVRFGEVVATRIACIGPALQVEQRYLKMLRSAAAWRVDGNQLVLFDDGSAELAKFERE